MLWMILAVIVVTFAICLFRALRVKRKAPYNLKLENSERAEEYAEKLSELIQIETISDRNSGDTKKFYDFHNKLEEMFPNIHKVCEKHDFDGSLLFKWKGKSSAEPVLFMNHLDVVEAKGNWTHPPFSGVIENGKLFGRGASDDKGPLFIMLQAAEESIEQGYVPQNDIYLASSCTEEISGDGAPKTVEYLKNQNVKLKFLIDEGGMIIDRPMSILKSTYAMVGVVEKGSGDIKFIARSIGGHASAPGRNTPLVRLGKFMSEIEDRDPFRVEFTSTFRELLKRMGPEMPFAVKFLTENLFLFEPLVKFLFKKDSKTMAMIKTTVAFTKASGSEGYNVLPQEAYVTGNIRYIPHQANDESIKVLTDIAKKYDIELEIIRDNAPPAVADYKNQPFKLVEEIIEKIYPNVVTIPYTMTGGTDAKFYDDVTGDALRFAPLFITEDQLNRIHGYDENINISSLPPGVDFYKEVIRRV